MMKQAKRNNSGKQILFERNSATNTNESHEYDYETNFDSIREANRNSSKYNDNDNDNDYDYDYDNKNKKVKDDMNDNDEKNREKHYLCCGRICTKSLVIIFNVLLLLCGVSLCLFASWTLTRKQDFIELINSFLYQVSIYSLILAGALLILAGLMAIISAWIESKKVLILYVGFLVFIFAIEATSGILAFLFHTALENNLKNGLDHVIKNQYNQTGFERQSTLLDMLQIELKCCGANNYHDWNSSAYVEQHKMMQSPLGQSNLVAESCCKTPSTFCAFRTHPSNINYMGCAKPLELSILKNLISLGVVIASVAIFQGIDLVLILLLIRRINQHEHYDHVDTEES